MNELTIMSQCFAQVRRVAKESPMYREKFKDIPVNTMMTKDEGAVRDAALHDEAGPPRRLPDGHAVRAER